MRKLKEGSSSRNTHNTVVLYLCKWWLPTALDGFA